MHETSQNTVNWTRKMRVQVGDSCMYCMVRICFVRRCYKMGSMKIRSMVRAGMLCAVYGVFLFVNIITGLWIETVFPYLFALPVLVTALTNDEKSSVPFCALCAMVLLTLMLSSLTTWLFAGSMLLSGYIIGRGLRKNVNVLLLVIASFALLFVINMLSMTIMAAVFGFDLVKETEGFAWIFAYVSPLMIVGLLALFQSLLEAIACALIGVILMMKILPHTFHVALPVTFDVPAWCGWILPLLLGAWGYTAFGMHQPPELLRDVLLALSLVDFELMVWQGYLDMYRNIVRRMHKEKDRKLRVELFAKTFAALVPVLNIYPALTGWVSCISSSFKRSKERGTV